MRRMGARQGRVPVVDAHAMIAGVPPKDSVSDIRVVTFNLASANDGPKWKVGDEHAARVRILQELLLRCDADFLCLQESVFSEAFLGTYRRVEHVATTHAGFTVLYVSDRWAIERDSKTTNKPRQTKFTEFPLCLAVRRSDGVAAAVCSLHLEPFAGSREKRAQQGSAVGESLQLVATERQPTCVMIAAGDMNMQRDESCQVAWLEDVAIMPESDVQWPTFDVANNDYNEDPRVPDRRPKTFRGRYDRVWAGGVRLRRYIRLGDCRVSLSGEPGRFLSDHYGLLVDLEPAVPVDEPPAHTDPGSPDKATLP